jgi:hypothetical protein
VDLLQVCRQQPGDAAPVTGDDGLARPVPTCLDPFPAADPDAIYRAGARREDPSIENSVAVPLDKRRMSCIE